MKNQVSLFEALSDENRLRVVNLLLVSPELSVGDLERILGLPQTRVSRHLSYLKNRGLVESRRTGTWKYYRLGPVFAENDGLRNTLHHILLRSEQCLADMELLLEGLDNSTITALQDASEATIESVIQKCCAAA